MKRPVLHCLVLLIVSNPLLAGLEPGEQINLTIRGVDPAEQQKISRINRVGESGGVRLPIRDCGGRGIPVASLHDEIPAPFDFNRCRHGGITPRRPTMKLLLIGHGYLGQAITREFREHGWEVTTTSLSGNDGTLACDIGNPDDVAKLPPADFIVHCAASGRGGAEAYQHVYVDGCRNLVEKFPGTPLLFTSSTSVYAQTDGSVVTEESPAIPDRETGGLLLEAERVTLAAGGVVARLAGIYGPGRSVILKKFLSGEAVIEEDGRRFLNQIHRDDAARAIYHLAASRATGVFNVSDSTPLTQLGCYERLGGIFSRPLPPSGPRDLNRKRGWTHKQVSNAKLRATGWQPRFPSFIDAAESVAATIISPPQNS